MFPKTNPNKIHSVLKYYIDDDNLLDHPLHKNG